MWSWLVGRVGPITRQAWPVPNSHTTNSDSFSDGSYFGRSGHSFRLIHSTHVLRTYTYTRTYIHTIVLLFSDGLPDLKVSQFVYTQVNWKSTNAPENASNVGTNHAQVDQFCPGEQLL